MQDVLTAVEHEILLVPPLGDTVPEAVAGPSICRRGAEHDRLVNPPVLRRRKRDEG